MPIGLVATDNRQHVVVFNQVAESVLQLPAPSVIGNPAGQVLPAALWAQVEAGSAPNAAILEKEVDCALAGAA